MKSALLTICRELDATATIQGRETIVYQQIL
jgi:hypothetical protein